MQMELDGRRHPQLMARGITGRSSSLTTARHHGRQPSPQGRAPSGGGTAGFLLKHPLGPHHRDHAPSTTATPSSPGAAPAAHRRAPAGRQLFPLGNDARRQQTPRLRGLGRGSPGSGGLSAGRRPDPARARDLALIALGLTSQEICDRGSCPCPQSRPREPPAVQTGCRPGPAGAAGSARRRRRPRDDVLGRA